MRNLLAVRSFLFAVTRYLVAVWSFLFAVIRYLIAVGSFLFAVIKNLTAVSGFLIAVRCFLLAVASFLNGVAGNLIWGLLYSYFFELYSFYLCVFLAGGSENGFYVFFYFGGDFY